MTDTHTLIQQLRSYANTLGLGWIAEAADCIAEQEKYRDLLDRQIDDLTNDFNGLCEINKSISERNDSLEALCSEQAKQLEDLRQVDIEALRQEVFDWKSLCEKGDKAIEAQVQRIAELEYTLSIEHEPVFDGEVRIGESVTTGTGELWIEHSNCGKCNHPIHRVTTKAGSSPWFHTKPQGSN